ncbi:diguanylate cyclase domain-containing protein [Bosea sp. MMO-172]|uniref:diguanylate cyclase domain-containing protein n=1 Tax=Bosea sp. MMO-172 TaxID=3127885 RepID=UPI003018EADE
MRKSLDVSVAAIFLDSAEPVAIEIAPDLEGAEWLRFAEAHAFMKSPDADEIWIADLAGAKWPLQGDFRLPDSVARFLAVTSFGQEGRGRIVVLDKAPRSKTPETARILDDLALIAAQHLALQERLQAAEDNEAQFRLLAEASTDTLVRGDLDGNRLYISPSVRTLLGYEPEELIGRKATELTHPHDAPRFRELMLDVREGRLDVAISEQRQRRKDGSWVWLEACLRLTHDAATSAPNGYVASVRDISRRKELEGQLQWKADHDDLTGMASRAAFDRSLSEMLVDAKADQSDLTVCYIDLDRFKQINDLFGHQVGDAVLVETAHRLRSSFGKGALIGRLGGDEFVVALSGMPGEAIRCAERFLAATERPIRCAPHEVVARASIGISSAGQLGGSPGQLLSAADQALYEAKARGRNTIYVFDQHSRQDYLPQRDQASSCG